MLHPRRLGSWATTAFLFPRTMEFRSVHTRSSKEVKKKKGKSLTGILSTIFKCSKGSFEGFLVSVDIQSQIDFKKLKIQKGGVVYCFRLGYSCTHYFQISNNNAVSKCYRFSSTSNNGVYRICSRSVLCVLCTRYSKCPTDLSKGEDGQYEMDRGSSGTKRRDWSKLTYMRLHLDSGRSRLE